VVLCVCVCVCACARVGCCVGIKEEGEEPRADSPLFKLLTERAPDLDAKTYLSWLKRFLPSGTHIGHHHRCSTTTTTTTTTVLPFTLRLSQRRNLTRRPRPMSSSAPL
jgi:hypothetical protein